MAGFRDLDGYNSHKDTIDTKETKRSERESLPRRRVVKEASLEAFTAVSVPSHTRRCAFAAGATTREEVLLDRKAWTEGKAEERQEFQHKTNINNSPIIRDHGAEHG